MCMDMQMVFYVSLSGCTVHWGNNRASVHKCRRVYRPDLLFVFVRRLAQAHPHKLMPLWEELAAVACAVQNMHLMATALSVAAYWSSWHDAARDSPQMLQFLGLDHEKGDRCVPRS